jgi:ferrous iron transport protein A
MTLNDLAVGQSARITRLDADAGFGRRLLDLGFTVGERVACLFSAPSGEPRAYLLCGTVIALRRENAKGVIIARCGGDPRV